jgi:DNA mismatch endonuclease (patch repair protein)
MDIVTRATRSRMMSAVPQVHSSPELAVRRLIHAMGYRFRLHQRSLPGSPDIVLSRLKKVIFVHGCFWHRHGCSKTTAPQTNCSFWNTKFAANRARDRRVIRHLRDLGWESIVVWECQLERPHALSARLARFLRA